MPVLTKAQSKRLALRSIRRLERDIQPGIRRVSRAWRRLRAGLAEDVLALEPVLDRVQKAFSGQTATLAGAMQLAYLRGLHHVLTVAKPHLPAQLALYDSAVANLETRLGMDAAGRAALAAQTGEKAARVLTLTGTALETRLREAVIDIGKREVTLGEAKKAMRRAIADTGLGPEKTYQLEAIFRTQTQISYNAGRWDALQDEAIQDVLWGYEYSTVGDDRVRDSHAELEGTRLPKDDPIWTTIWPPNGWNCRCTTIEIFEPEPVKWTGGTSWQPDKGFAFDPRGTFDLPKQPVKLPPIAKPRKPTTPAGPTPYVTGQFLPSKTKAAAARDLLNRGLVTGTVDYSGTTIEVANLINKEIIEQLSFTGKKLAAVGPTTKALKAIGIRRRPRGMVMFVARKGDDLAVGYSTRYAGSMDALRRSSDLLETKGIMKGVSPLGIAKHEIGHARDFMSNLTLSKGLAREFKTEFSVFGQYQDVKIREAKNKLAKKIGHYSLTNDREAFAEVYRVWSAGQLPPGFEFIDRYMKRKLL